MKFLMLNQRGKVIFGKFSFILALFILVYFLPKTTYCRQWTSDDGKFSAEADLLEQQDNHVKLKKADGAVILVPLSKLSKSDIEFLKTQNVSAKNNGIAFSKQRTSGKIRTFAQLVEATKSYSSPKMILIQYKEFIADESIEKDQRDAATKQIPIWENRINKNMVRVGLNWLDPVEALKRKDKAKILIDEALQLIEVKQSELAIKKLTEASTLYPKEIKADFLLGLGYALLGRDSKEANKHFDECVRRSPAHISSLNNLALTNVRLGKFNNALNCWRTAISVAPATPEIIQNLGRLLNQATKHRINVPSHTLSEIGSLYASASTANNQKFDPHKGWLYMCYYETDNLTESVNASLDTKSALNKELLKIGSGSGFIISPRFILTNRHVAESGSAFVIVTPEGNKELPATLVAMSEDAEIDLAILRCDQLEAPALPFIKEKLAKRSTDVIIVGFPGISEKNPSIKSTRGIIAGMPDDSNNMYYVDALSNPGNSGGPVCDNAGNVLGIHTARTLSLRSNYALETPHYHAIPLLEKNIPNYKPLLPYNEKKSWPEIDAIVSKSTVLIWIQQPLSKIGLNKNPIKDKSGRRTVEPIEDPWCMRCSGIATVECPDSHCRNGTVLQTQVDSRVVNNVGFVKVTKSSVPVRCNVCNGKGRVSCPDCVDGYDKEWSSH